MPINNMINIPGVTSQLAGRIAEHNAAVGSGEIPGDVHSLVQQVLRQSYMDNTQDLYFYANKVKFYNACRKKIRDELTRARDHMASYGAGIEDGDAIPPYTPVPINTDPIMKDVPDEVLTEQINAAEHLSGKGLKEFDKSKAPANSDLAGANLDGYDVVTTEDGYTVAYKGSKAQVFNEDGEQILQVSGDPHVFMGGGDEGTKLDGENAWHFGNDSTFVLPDGTKLTLDTEPNDKGEYYTVGVTVLSGDQAAVLDGKSGTGVSITNDRAALDAKHADKKAADASSGVFFVTETGECLGQGDDGKWYKVTKEDWETYKGDRDIELDTSQEVKVSVEQSRSLLDGDTVAAAAKGAKVTKAELDAYIKQMEEELNSVGEDAQLANVDLQNMLQKQQQTMQQMSNISKLLHDTALAIIRKIG